MMHQSKRRDAAEALKSLGYSEKEADKALRTVKYENSEMLEDIIKKCLKVLMN